MSVRVRCAATKAATSPKRTERRACDVFLGWNIAAHDAVDSARQSLRLRRRQLVAAETVRLIEDEDHENHHDRSEPRAGKTWSEEIGIPIAAGLIVGEALVGVGDALRIVISS